MIPNGEHVNPDFGCRSLFRRQPTLKQCLTFDLRCDFFATVDPDEPRQVKSEGAYEANVSA
jgi:hypothetical protein